MTTTPTKTVTSKTVNNKTGVTTSKSTVTSGKNVTQTSTTTIGKSATAPKTTTAAKTTTAKKATTTPAKLAREALGSKWLVGPNDTRPLCAPVAVANALLGALLVEPSNADIERLYRAAAGIGDTGVPVPAALAAARREGLAGCRLKEYCRAGLDDADVLLLDFGAELGVHAAAFAGMNVIAWGDEIPLEDLNAQIIGAWSLTWHGEESSCR